jgi:hypothetical protein
MEGTCQGGGANKSTKNIIRQLGWRSAHNRIEINDLRLQPLLLRFVHISPQPTILAKHVQNTESHDILLSINLNSPHPDVERVRKNFDLISETMEKIYPFI